MHLIDKILECIFIPSCGMCGRLGEGYLCEKCSKELKKYMINNVTDKEKNNKFHIFTYENIVRELILNYKFNDKPYLYRTFCEIIVKNKKIMNFIKSYDIIIPVPMHKKKMKIRGYNQSELIAREIAKSANIKLAKDVLIKVKNNEVQSSLSKLEREENVKDVYKVMNGEKLYNKNVLIFDDIYTTGATINSCMAELEKSSIKKLGVLTLAKD